jgi:hypothetical protein
MCSSSAAVRSTSAAGGVQGPTSLLLPALDSPPDELVVLNPLLELSHLAEHNTLLPAPLPNKLESPSRAAPPPDELESPFPTAPPPEDLEVRHPLLHRR